MSLWNQPVMFTYYVFVFMAQGCEIYDAEEVYYHFHTGIKWAAPLYKDGNSQ